ncbi:MAG: hypothetical protein R2939_10755 [Kofleriaceae bacterium]
MTPGRRRALTVCAWVLVAAPALYQLGLLATAIAGRVSYPYDLEWMEGGLLHHAERIGGGGGIYVPPSIDFIPYLYTPLYPGLLAALGKVVGLGYTLGRAVSVLALVGLAGVALASLVGPARRARARAVDLTGPALAGAVVALGVFAAAYPYVEGWYDLVRADTLALLMITGGIHAAARWGGRHGVGPALLGALMGLAFFTKQTAILYVAWVGLVVTVTRVVAAPRRDPRAGARRHGAAGLRRRRRRGRARRLRAVSGAHRRLVLDLRLRDPPGPRLQHGSLLALLRQHPRQVASPDRDHRGDRGGGAPRRGVGGRCRRRRGRSSCGPPPTRCRRWSARSAGAPSSPTSTRTCRRSCTAAWPSAPRCRRWRRA